MYSYPLVVTWELPREAIPAGAQLIAIQATKICGSSGGDFWETYGPDGSDPTEHEFGAPQPDGCWYYGPAPGPDTTVVAAIRLQSTFTITMVEYTVTIAR